ncbi:MAG: DUF5131 family protein [Phycisphaerae bacterium]|jgi:protein gp37
MKQKGNKIGWCDKTANPVWGCLGNCEYCYARGINNRYKRIPDFSKPQFFPQALKEFRTKEPLIIFIDSMSDIGYWEGEWRAETLRAILANPQNIYLALTKRYDYLPVMRGYIDLIPSKPRFYIGATITNNKQAERVIAAGGADFISFEPLMERIRSELLEQLKCRWWIVGDLTKNGKPQEVTEQKWVSDMNIEAVSRGIPIFMKDSLYPMIPNLIKQFPEGWKV